jgi:hypothetical protein
VCLFFSVYVNVSFFHSSSLYASALLSKQTKYNSEEGENSVFFCLPQYI